MATPKKSRRSNTNNKKQSLPWGPMLISFAVGLFVMFLLHLHNDESKNKTSKSKAVEAPIKKKQNFDFYKILPENKVSKPTKQPIKNDIKPSEKPAQTYIIQVASFRKLTDADAVKAKLALLGIESKVETVTVDNNSSWNRVQIGPIISQEKAEKIQKKLNQNKIKSILIQIKKS